MYIHLGNNYIISAPSIIAILNYEPRCLLMCVISWKLPGWRKPGQHQ